MLQGDSKYSRLLSRLSGSEATIALHGEHMHAQGHPQALPSFFAWRAWPSGCTVVAGTISLPREGIMLLSGHGAHFKHTTFSGAGPTKCMHHAHHTYIHTTPCMQLMRLEWFCRPDSGTGLAHM